MEAKVALKGCSDDINFLKRLTLGVGTTTLLFFIVNSPAFAYTCYTVGGDYTQNYPFRDGSFMTITVPANLPLNSVSQPQRNIQANLISETGTGVRTALGVTDAGYLQSNSKTGAYNWPVYANAIWEGNGREWGLIFYVPISCNLGVNFIQIQGGSSVEPWHKKHDPNHTNANLPYKAIVKDQNGQPKANIAVTITTDVTSDSGGHVHTAGRLKGKLVDKVGAAVSTKDGKETISGATDGSGIFSFTFGAEEVSGEHKLTATCTGCTAPAESASIAVKVDGLEQIPNASFYTFIGSTDKHDKNHYLTSDAATNMLYVAASYHAEVKYWKKPKGKQPIPPLPLQLNDASLIWGGLFDIKGNWTTPHVGHRKGVVIDVRANDDTGATGAIPLSSFDNFKKMALSYYGADAQVHCTSNKTDGQNRKPPTCVGKDGSQDPNRHFHILLLGDDQ